ncbi:MAG: helicase HerA domain-containing protein, partial [Acidimicrobiales bacterium]
MSGSALSRGRLFGKNVLEATFRASPDEDLFLGELLVGVDEATGRRYLFRVVDVTYGSEHREPGWAERVAGTLLTDDARGEAGAHRLHEQARRTYRVASCRCLGYLTPDGRDFRKPKSLPTQFSRVVSPEPADFDFLRTRMGDLAVGLLRSGETTVDFEVGISGASLATHVGVFATTGMGKSNLVKVLAAGVLRAQGRYGLLLVDPHGEYRTSLARHPWAASRLRTYAARKLPNTSTLR